MVCGSRDGVSPVRRQIAEEAVDVKPRAEDGGMERSMKEQFDETGVYEELPEQKSMLAQVFGEGGSEWLRFCGNRMSSRLTGKKLENSAFTVRGRREKLLDRPIAQKFMAAFCYEGIGYEISFSKLFRCPRTKIEVIETEEAIFWNIRQGDRRTILITNIRCPKGKTFFAETGAWKKSGEPERYLRCREAQARVKLYQRDGEYCTLIDDVDIEGAKCEFGVV